MSTSSRMHDLVLEGVDPDREGISTGEVIVPGTRRYSTGTRVSGPWSRGPTYVPPWGTPSSARRSTSPVSGYRPDKKLRRTGYVVGPLFLNSKVLGSDLLTPFGFL